jgi:hypothetical protein
MNNILDQIYKDYKNNGNYGVPNPHIEEDLDCTKVRICECGSLNVSIDLATNKTICRKCGKTTDTPNKIDFQKEIEKMQEDEDNKTEEAIKRGVIFDD